MNGYIEQIRKKNPKYRFIDSKKVWINRDTPVGDSANFYERKPHDGLKLFYPVCEVKDSVLVDSCLKHFNYKEKRWDYDLPPELLDFLSKSNIIIP
jgi:hypothetical protein